MSIRYFIAIASLFASLCACGAATADGGDAVSAFMKQRSQLPQVVMNGGSLADVLNDPTTFAGRAIELTGTVVGLVASGDNRSVLFKVDNTTVTGELPESLRDTLWSDTGRTMRVIFIVQAPGNEPESLRLVAAASETDVAAAEQAEAQRHTEQTSRYMAYSRDGDSRAGSDYSEPMPPGGYGDDGGQPSPALSSAARAIFGPYHAAIRRFNPDLADSDLDTITNSILYFSQVNQIDPRLIVAMIVAESDFDIYSHSNKGAMGLGQLMPETARGMGVTDPYDPVQNIAASVTILRNRLDDYGGPLGAGVIPYDKLALVMAAYNAGSGAVQKYHGVPPFRETQRYVQKVAELYREMCGG
jgi:hypothetical protein